MAKYCTKCGHHLRDTSKFCAECGAPVAGVSARPQPLTEASVPAERFPPRLATLGFDLRISNGVEAIIPPVCAVPGGEFLMGLKARKEYEQMDPDGGFEHRVVLAAFQIARFPITVAEYACFVRTEDRRPPPKGRYNSLDWEQQLLRLDHPVVAVTWYDAVEYAAWLRNITGQPWRLPTEAQWEKAACWDGATGHARLYPYGDDFNSTRCNVRESGVGMTAAVGTYPRGASPCGAQDMASNVFEFTSSLWKWYPHNVEDGGEQLDFSDSRVVRGSHWDTPGKFAGYAAHRRSYELTDGSDLVGFRVALTPER